MARFITKCAALNHVPGLQGGDLLIMIFPTVSKKTTADVANYFFTLKEVTHDRISKSKREIFVCSACVNRVKSYMSAPRKPPTAGVPQSLGSVSSPMEIDSHDQADEDAKHISEKEIIDFIQGLTDTRVANRIYNAARAKFFEIGGEKEPSQIGQTAAYHTICDSNAIVSIGKEIQCELVRKSKSNTELRLEKLENESYDTIWNVVPPIWRTLLNIITDGYRSPNDRRSTRLLVKATECIQYILDQNFISPLAHSEAMLVLQISRSRYAVDIFSQIQPSGSYTSIKKTIKALALRKNSVPGGYILLGFDNNQTIQRTWSVQYKGRQKNTTVTSIVIFKSLESIPVINEDVPTILEWDENLGAALLQRYALFRRNAEEKIGKYIQNIVQAELEKIVYEKATGKTERDDAGISVPLTYDIIKRQEGHYDVLNFSCLPVNPASFDAVRLILDELLKLKNMDTERKFVPIYMDGSPHGLCLKIISNTHICEICQTEVLDRNSHLLSVHGGDMRVDFKLKYEGMIIRPGNGHVEMMLVKCIINTFWEPFFHPVAKMIGYNSPASLEYCRKASDHHKSWQMILIVLSSLLRTILSGFYEQFSGPDIPNCRHFLEFSAVQGSNNVMFRLTYSFLFDVLIPLYIFRSSMRQGNDNEVLYAREYVSRILFGSHHPKYHKILTYDTLYLLSLSREARDVISKETCRKAKSSIGQPFDFQIEELNKAQKSYLPSDGAPSFSQWNDVVNSMHHLEKIRDITWARLGMAPPDSQHSQKEFSTEIKAVTAYFRENLQIFNPRQATLLTSEGQEIHPQFKDFYAQCNKNQHVYFSEYLHRSTPHLPCVNFAIIPQNLQLLNHAEVVQHCRSLLSTISEPSFSFFRRLMAEQRSVTELQEFYAALLRHVDLQKRLEIIYD